MSDIIRAVLLLAALGGTAMAETPGVMTIPPGTNEVYGAWVRTDPAIKAQLDRIEAMVRMICERQLAGRLDAPPVCPKP